ncbi:hypothetical protein AAEO50_15945 [Rossellomorea oryzaecorticis]|uniref:Uncharacterized protein n=1 Tax=Rossellomorea oryzaecorticis TaxID=1396505 RepID=A0ABU9KE90_9BACI
MNHAIVMAAQQFLGFELCSALLERGWTVTAVDDDEEPKDKWMEIGRNANIQYVPSHAWNRELPAECRLFLPYYDQYKGNKLECISLIDHIYENNEDFPEIVQIFSNLTERTREIKSRKTAVATFYLPTLYGVHQPSHFLFSQVLQGREDEELHYADDPSGAIYVKDAAKCIIKHSGKHGTYSLKPLSDNSWKEALSYITDETITPSMQAGRLKGDSITVHPSKSHESILNEQKERMNAL